MLGAWPPGDVGERRILDGLVVGGEPAVVEHLREDCEDLRVRLPDLVEQDVDRTVKQIEKAGGKALALIADVSHPVQMKNSVDALADYYGRLDVVFANADRIMVMYAGRIVEIGPGPGAIPVPLARRCRA